MDSTRTGRPLGFIRQDSNRVATINDRRQVDNDDRAIRVEDYLNDKIQVEADLLELDLLIENVETQRAQLETQLQDAQIKLNEARATKASHDAAIGERIQSFRAQQESINKRLMIVSGSDAPDAAARSLKLPLEKLHRLELARSYIELLEKVDDLSVEAHNQLPEHPKEALKIYSQLKQISLSLRELQGPAEGAAGHIVDHVDNVASSLWSEMRKIVSSEFKAALKKQHWPSVDCRMTSELSDTFVKLLDLQMSELLAASDVQVLYPMASLAKPFVQQFRYHFLGDRPTNSLQNPELFLDWTTGTISKWEDTLYEHFAPLLAGYFKSSRLADNTAYTNPVSAFITALFPIVQEKVEEVLDKISREPQSLSNFMILLMKFDDSIRNNFKYDGGDAKAGWKGLTWTVLQTWFPRWEGVEKDFALARYEEIIATKDSGLIDYDSTGIGGTKFSYGAAKVMDLLGNVTHVYRPLRSLSWKIRFLIDIQVEILDRYHNRLKDSLDAYQAMTSAVGRTLHGISREEQAALEGVGGLESLCKVYCSANHVIDALADWSDQMFFVELWSQLHKRAQVTDPEATLAGTMSYNDVKRSISGALGSEQPGSTEDGSVFDETIAAYTRRREHSKTLMVDALKQEFSTTLRPYFNKPQWMTVDEDTDNAVQRNLLTVTAELDQPLQALSSSMGFLHKTLGVVPFRAIWREALNFLQSLLWNEVLMKERYTTLGAAQFYRDLSAIWAVIDEYIPYGSSSALGMPKLKEAVQLLNLPTAPSGELMSISQAYDRVFQDNNEARKVLEELGLLVISFAEARLILQRRVEASS